MPVSWRMPRPDVTVQQLREMLVAPSRGAMAFPSEPYDEVYPGIVISDVATAFTLSLLRSLGVTHVLNAAHGTDNATYSGCYVNMHPSFYRSAGLGFMRVPAEDAEECNIGLYFSEAAEFIDTARRHGGAGSLCPGHESVCSTGHRLPHDQTGNACYHRSEHRQGEAGHLPQLRLPDAADPAGRAAADGALLPCQQGGETPPTEPASRRRRHRPLQSLPVMVL